jgi:hypothetical protein
MWKVEQTLDGNTAVVGPLRISAVLQKETIAGSCIISIITG